jgi:hypothetical protein
MLLSLAQEARAMSQEPTLKALTISPGVISPGFSRTRRQYTVRLPSTTDAVRLTASADDPGAGVTVNGTPVVSGHPSSPVSLAVGRNLIDVGVTAPGGGAGSHYTVKVIRSYPTPTWVKVRDESPWIARDSAGELVFKDRMWLLGGYIPELINDVWSSTDGTNWTKGGSVPCESGINIPVNLVYGGRMWVVCNDGQLFSSEDGSHWDLVTNQAPWRGRYAAGGVAFAGKMWVMGGMKGDHLFNDIWSSTDGVHWDLETEHAPWSRRQLFSMVTVYDDKIWLVGGGITVYHPFRAYNDVWNSPDGKNWSKVTDGTPWPARIWSSSVVYRNRLWVLGGFRSEPVWTNLDDAWYSADGAHWQKLETESIWSARHEISAYVFGGKLWVVAGNSWPLKNDVWCLEIPGLAFLSQPVIEEFVTAQYSYQAHADFNQSRKPIRFRLLEQPAWLTIDRETGLIRGTPETIGDATVTVEAYDEAGETARQTYTLHVVPLR